MLFTRPLSYCISPLLAVLAGFDISASRVNAAAPQPQAYYQAWADEFDLNSPTSEGATAATKDSRGNVIVVGFVLDPGDGTTKDFYTAKYDALDGHLDWSQTKSFANGPGIATCVAVDSNDNVYVGGGGTVTSTNNEDFCLQKYNSAGTPLFTRTFNGTNSGQDEIRKIAIDASDDVIVTGLSADAGTGIDIRTIVYNSAGTVLHNLVYNNTGNSDDEPSSIAIDSLGNIAVGGFTDVAGTFSFVTLRYTSAGVLTWSVVTDAGGGYGASSVAFDSSRNVFTTGHFLDNSNHDGYYTVKFNGSTGAVIWHQTFTSSEFNADGATSLAVDGNNDVIVAGDLDNGLSGPAEAIQIFLVKYNGLNGSFVWSTADSGTSGSISHAAQVTTDAANNPVLVGDTENLEFAQDLYVAKFNGSSGLKIWSDTFAGSDNNNDCVAVGQATDSNGDIIMAGTAWREFNNTGIGHTEIATIKYNHLFLETNDPLPATTGLAANPTVFSLDPPAVDDAADVAALITANSGRAKVPAILVENSGGGIVLPAVQKNAAVGVTGGKYLSFSDPILAPNGAYAFAGRLSGVPKSQASGVWSDINGNLNLVLQQGKPVPGLPSVNVSSVMSLSMRNNELLALMKVTGSPTQNTLLLGINSALTGTPLVRTGQAISIGGTATTVKSITFLTPTPHSPGDGRWQGDGLAVVKILTANKITAICSVSTNGILTPLLFTGESASSVVNGAMWKSFSLPSIGSLGSWFTLMGNLAPLKGSVTPADDTALVYSFNGAFFSTYLHEGDAPVDASLTGLKYSGFIDPIMNANATLTTIATVSGHGATAANNKVLLEGNLAVARTGGKAPNPDGSLGTDTFSSFSDIALPAGGEPVFTATIKGAGVNGKNNTGLWAVDSTGAVRRLLRNGDVLGKRTLASFTVLTSQPKDLSVSRSFNASSDLSLLLKFTDRTMGIVNLGVP